MSDELTELPEGWCHGFLNELGQLARGKSKHRPRNDPKLYGEFVPFIQTGEVARSGGRISTFSKMYSEFGVQQSRIFPKETVCITIAANIADTGILGFDACFPDSIVGLIADTRLANPYFVEYFLRTIREDLAQFAPATAQANINLEILNQVSVPLPPLNEQKRIVTKIEELRDRHQAAKQALEEVPKLCDRFRQSVLAAAFRGDLTADWREENPDVEPASVLLERIRIERQKSWEKADDNKRKSKYKEPIRVDPCVLPEIPLEWEWVSLDSLITYGPQNGLYLPQTAYGIGVPILRIDNFQDGWSNSSEELRLVNASENDIALYSLQEDDLVINRVNSPSHLGKTLLVEPRNLPSLFESNMMRLKIAKTISVKYLELYLRSPLGKKLLTEHAKWAVNQASINQTDVKTTAIPIPPLQEQIAVVEAVAKLLAFSQGTAESVQDSQDFLAILNQSVLAKAFRGELVEQDPNDEPASVLLDRIRAEREALQGSKTKKSTKGKQRKTSNKIDEQLEMPGLG